jgi:rubredoxin
MSPMAASQEMKHCPAKPAAIYQCQTASCGYLYKPERGDRMGQIPPGIKFEDLSEDWCCPLCGASQRMFRPLSGPGSVAEAGK